VAPIVAKAGDFLRALFRGRTAPPELSFEKAVRLSTTRTHLPDHESYQRKGELGSGGLPRVDACWRGVELRRERGRPAVVRLRYDGDGFCLRKAPKDSPRGENWVLVGPDLVTWRTGEQRSGASGLDRFVPVFPRRGAR